MTNEELTQYAKIQIIKILSDAEKCPLCTIKVVHNDIQEAMELVGSVLNKLKIPFASVNDDLITGMHNILTENSRWVFKVCEVQDGSPTNAINGIGEQEAKHVHEYFDREYEIYSPHFQDVIERIEKLEQQLAPMRK